MKRPLLTLFLILAAWKILRTDWVVTRAWYTDNSIHCPGLINGYHNAFHRPPVSPAWNPPRLVDYDLTSFSSGASFAIGEAKLRPDWLLIGLKIGLPLFAIISVNALRWMLGKNNCLSNLVRELIAESKRQREPR